MTRFEIRIDEMVLHGLPPEYADGLAGRIEQELRRLALDADPTRFSGGVHAAVRPRPGQAAVSDVEGLARLAAVGVWAAVTGTPGEGAAR